MKETYNIKIEEWVEATIWQNGMLRETLFFKGNTVSATGKEELAQLVGGLDSKTIDTIWAKIGGTMQAETSTNSQPGSGPTLAVETASAYTIPGQYTAVYTGNASLGTASFYNSIAITFTLPSDSEVDFTVKWVFSGSSESGDAICAARLGKIGNTHDNPISSIEVWETGGPSPEGSMGVDNAVSNNTLNITHSSPFAGPDSINFVMYTTGIHNFEKFQGFTIDVGAGQDFYFEADFIFG